MAALLLYGAVTVRNLIPGQSFQLLQTALASKRVGRGQDLHIILSAASQRTGLLQQRKHLVGANMNPR